MVKARRGRVCFDRRPTTALHQRLMPGSYSISVQPAANTTATSDKRWGVPLTGGSTVNINFGSRSGESSGAASRQYDG